LGVDENEPRLIIVGKPQPIEAPFEDKTVRAGMLVVASRLPKADNTWMVGGRGLLHQELIALPFLGFWKLKGVTGAYKRASH